MASIDTIVDRSTGSAVAGKAYFETSTNKFIIYNGSSWVEIDSDGTGAVPFENRWSASFTESSLDISGIASSINSLTQVSWSAWYKGTGLSGYIFRASPSGAANPHIGMSINSNSLYATISNGSANRFGTHGTAINDGDWHHLAVTYNGVTGTVKSYVDGNEGNALSGGTVPSNVGTGYTAATIGTRPHPTLYADGIIDDVAIWNSELSALDIEKIYNGEAPNGKPTDLTKAASYDTDRTSSLIGYWRMGDDSNDTATAGGSISTITDSSGNGNHATQGTAVNQPTFFSALASSETIYS